MDFSKADIAKLVSALSLQKDDFQKRDDDFTITHLYDQCRTFDNFNSKRFLYKL